MKSVKERSAVPFRTFSTSTRATVVPFTDTVLTSSAAPTTIDVGPRRGAGLEFGARDLRRIRSGRFSLRWPGVDTRERP